MPAPLVMPPPSGRRRALQAIAAGVRTPLGATSFALLALIACLAALGPVLWGQQAGAVDTGAVLHGPSSAHWLGTDGLGRDLLARTLVAVRLSVGLALTATAVGVTLGIFIGALPWFLPARAGRFAVAAVNTAIAFPTLLLVLFFAVILGVGTLGAILAVGFAIAPYFARITNTLVAGVRDRDYVAAARVAGAGRLAIFARHILPNIGEPLVVTSMTTAGAAMVAFAGLSFLGLGIQPPAYDLGILLSEAFEQVYINPVAVLGPAVLIVLAGVGFNLTGEVVAKQIGLRTDLPTPPEPAATGQTATGDVSEDGDDVVLDVRELTVTVPGPRGVVRPVRGVSVAIARGESVGMVGESGSGKSMTALAIAGLIEAPATVTAERLQYLGRDARAVEQDEVTRRLLGSSLGMVFQDLATSLNPTIRVGRQLAEVSQVNGGLGRRAAMERAVDRLRTVRVPAAARRARQYPHEFSGGMRQRAMIAMSIMGEPALIVADEPTTALDVTVQRQVLAVLRQVRRDRDTAILFISHDITIVRQMCDRILVMYAGRIVEDLPSSQVTEAQHPYTRALLSTIPDMHVDRAKPLATIPGGPVEPGDRPDGCAFAPRCPIADDRCRTDDPPLVARGPGRVACWRAGEPVPAVERAGSESGIEVTS